MRRLPDLSACVLLLALAEPAKATAPAELCEVLALMGAVLTLPSEDDTPRRNAKMEQRLILKAHQALEMASGQGALPVATIRQYREILSDRVKGRRPDPAHSETLDRVTKKVQQDWRQLCKRAEDHGFAPDKSDAKAIGARQDSGKTPEHLGRGISEKSRSPENRISSSLSGVTAAHQWRMLATVIAAVGIFGLAGKGYVEMQGRRKRRARRFPCDLAGRLSMDTGKEPVSVRDISRLGCLLRMDRGPPAKTRCHVWIHDRWLEARVVWSNKCYVGLEFRQLQSREFIIGVARSGRREVHSNPLAATRIPRQSK